MKFNGRFDLLPPLPPSSLLLEITSTNIYEILLDEVNDRYNKQIQFFPPPNSISTGIWKISLLSIVFYQYNISLEVNGEDSIYRNFSLVFNFNFNSQSNIII